LDYAVFAHAHTAETYPDRERYVSPVDIRLPGVMSQIAYGWDDPKHHPLAEFSAEVNNVPFDVHVQRMREVAREWLDQTNTHPSSSTDTNPTGHNLPTLKTI
jgi:hypothetical protein